MLYLKMTRRRRPAGMPSSALPCCRTRKIGRVFHARLAWMLIFLFTDRPGAVANVGVEAMVEVPGGCECSPFSGNQGGCCTDGQNTCGNWFESAICGIDTHKDEPFCCNSKFSSSCCSTSACTAGCRDSAKGHCTCKAQSQSLAAIGFNRSTAKRALALLAASQCDTPSISRWVCAACTSVAPVNINVTEADGHLAYTGFDPENGVIFLAFRGSLTFKDWMSDLDAIKQSAYHEVCSFPHASAAQRLILCNCGPYCSSIAQNARCTRVFLTHFCLYALGSLPP